MLKSDYTTKMIEQFKKAMEKIDSLKSENDWNSVLAVIDSSFKEIFRLGSSFFNSLSYENILDIVTMNGSIEQDRCIIVAKFLEEEAEAFNHINQEDESVLLFQKSLRLFLEAFSTEKKADLEEYFSDIKSIYDKIDYLDIGERTKLQLIDYFKAKGIYTKCEDLLYEILEDNSDSQYIEKGIEFYKNLLDKTDGELEDADLPRDEVLDGLSRLQNMYKL